MSVTLTTNTGTTVQWDGSSIEAPTEEINLVETAPPEPEWPEIDPFPEYSSAHPDDGTDTTPVGGGGGGYQPPEVPQQTAPPEIPTEPPPPEEVRKGGKPIEPQVDRTGKKADVQGNVTEKNAQAKTELVWKVNAETRPGQTQSKVEIGTQTTYKDLADRNAQSGYGRGTTAEDRKNGNTSLAFHEEQHRKALERYVDEHPPPQPRFTEGMNNAEIKQETERWNAEMAAYAEQAGKATKAEVDDVGKTKAQYDAEIESGKKK